jgi:hypothetical protein
MHDLEPRIERMYQRDRWIAIAMVIALVATLGVVYRAIAPVTGSVPIDIVLGVAAALVALFNAASIRAMLHHNREDKTFIYTLDIKHLDEYRVSQAAQSVSASTEDTSSP